MNGWRYLLLLPILAVAGCETTSTTDSGAVGVERKQSMLVSSEQVNEAADKQYDAAMKQARDKGVLNQNAEQLARVRRITQRLVPASTIFRPDAAKWDWEVNVINTKQLNAWCMPGGKMAVYSGLIEQLELTDSELAAVMGHEIAHALREHARERISRQMATSTAVSIGAAIFGVGQTGANIGQAVADVTFNLPNSRLHESEADAIGVELAARAGYNPNGSVTVWQKMLKAGGGGQPEFLSTHPSPENRIEELRQHAQKVMPLYQASRKAD